MSTTTVKSKSISFNAEMVRATIDGDKTQTRRVVKSPAKNMQAAGMEVIKNREPGDKWYGNHVWSMRGKTGVWGDYTHERFLSMCPYGKVGDRLQIKDTPNRIEITDVRVERLQDISEQDAIAEGLSSASKDGQLYKYGIPDIDGLPGTDDHGWEWQDWCADPVKAFNKLWDSINGKHETKCWDANPWVWVVEFKVLSTTGEAA